jgi:hypothetical protein
VTEESNTGKGRQSPQTLPLVSYVRAAIAIVSAIFVSFLLMWYFGSMALKDLLTLARIIQSILTPLALVGAAAWAIYTFSELRQVSHAQTTIKKTEVEILDLEREAKKAQC